MEDAETFARYRRSSGCLDLGYHTVLIASVVSGVESSSLTYQDQHTLNHTGNSQHMRTNYHITLHHTIGSH